MISRSLCWIGSFALLRWTLLINTGVFGKSGLKCNETKIHRSLCSSELLTQQPHTDSIESETFLSTNLSALYEDVLRYQLKNNWMSLRLRRGWVTRKPFWPLIVKDVDLLQCSWQGGNWHNSGCSGAKHQKSLFNYVCDPQFMIHDEGFNPLNYKLYFWFLAPYR